MPRIASRVLQLTPDRRAPGRAREAVAAALAEIHLTDLIDDALLLTTELMTNAVIHAGTDIRLTIEASESGLIVTVSDQRRLVVPEIDMVSGPTAVSGRGLILVDRLADRWGTTHDNSGKSVWFEMSAGRPPVTIDPPDPSISELIEENDRLRHGELRRRASLTYMAETSDLLAQSLDIDLTYALIPRLVVPRLGAWCAVYKAVDGMEAEFAAATHEDETTMTALLKALDEPSTRPVLRAAVRYGDRGALSAADGVAVPLEVRGRRLGVLAVGRPDGRRHDPEEVALIADLARRSALALDNAMLHADRARITDTLQQALLPPVLPMVPGLSFAAEYIPTIGPADVGGDFYDVLPLLDGRWLMVIGDVSGKGVAAAAVTGLVRDVIRILAREGRSVPEILDRIHETLFERGAGRFATLAIAEVSGDGPDVRVTLHLAGHDRPILVSTDGRTTPVGSFGTVLGLLDAITTTGVEVVMAPGDTLVFFTDGVTERRRGDDLFGNDRTHATLAPLAGHDADIVAARLRAAAIGFSTEAPRDDIAILTLRNSASADPSR